ncbi:hypothetical protein [Paraburkholderia sp. J12]|uniref:hypothetical protein n=1 Tax=Paraburkholderia sp. J12 TaxID=2805432 RepID=UPI002ABD953F|nr:hypothetical protein [Paraburkholderia sp. J12]
MDNLHDVFHSVLVSDGQLMSPDEVRTSVRGIQNYTPTPDWCLAGRASEALFADLYVGTDMEMTFHPVEGGAAGNHVIVAMDTLHAHHAFVIPMFDPPSQEWSASLGDRIMRFSIGTHNRESLAKTFRGRLPEGTQEILRALHQDVRSVDTRAVVENLPRISLQAAALVPRNIPGRVEQEVTRSISLVAPQSILKIERIRTETQQDTMH